MFRDAFKCFTVDFDAPNGRDVFTCGDVISGRIIFDLSKEVRVTKISMTANGKARVAWTADRRKNRTHYSAKEDYFNTTCDIMEQKVAIGAGKILLRGGTHVYPFRFQLPHGNFPSAFQGVKGRVMYTLVVEIHRPWHFAKEFRTELNFVSHIDANHPQLLAPLSASKSKELYCFCCASGPLSMDVRLERKGYVPGEMIQ
ncbi:arrestin domain-containing protein 3-like, partial [Conger conger]